MVISVGDRTVMLPRSARRLDADSLDLLAEIQELAIDAARLEVELLRLTRLGREVGISWALLAAVQGLTGEGLRRRLSEEDST